MPRVEKYTDTEPRLLARLTSRLAIAWVLLAAWHPSAVAASTLWLDSEAGDPLGGGQSHALGASGSTLLVSTDGLEFRITEQFPSGSFGWSFVFLPPALTTIGVGTYADAEEFQARRPQQAGMYVSSASGTRCVTNPGRFVVHELVQSPGGGPVQTAALDFELHCDGAAALRGYFRYNSSLPKLLPRPTAITSTDQYVEEGAPVSMSASGSFAGDVPIAGYAWRQLSGPAVTLQNAATHTATFTAPEVSAAGESLVLEVEVRDINGRTNAAPVTVHVSDRAGAPTRVVIDGAVGEYITQGLDASYTLQTARIRALPFDAKFPGYVPMDNGIVVEVISDGFVGWNMTFFAPGSRPLAVETYVDTVSFPSPSAAAMNVTYLSRGCNTPTGQFDVREIELDTVAGTVNKLALDFEQYCDGAPIPARGHIRINSLVPLTRDAPVAAAGRDQIVGESTAVQLDGSASFSTSSSITSWRWRQTSGPTVALSGAASPAATFVAPAVATGTAALVFELEVTSANGLSDTDLVSISALSSTAPRNAFQFWSPPDDPVGGGINAVYDDVDGVFEFWPPDQVNGLMVRFTGAVGGRSNIWYFRFTAPGGALLTTGAYENAQRWPFNSPLAPGLDVTSGLTNTGCNSLDGRFDVLELVRDPVTGQPTRAAVDFWQQCDEVLRFVPFRGALRIGSSVPTVRRAPDVTAGPDQEVLEREPVLLDGSRSVPGEGTITAWTWRQVSGPVVLLHGANTDAVSFEAPAVTPPSEVVELELTATSSNGTSDTDRVQVRVVSKREPRTYIFIDAEPGAYVGNGVDHLLRPQDGLLTVAQRPQDLALEIEWISDQRWTMHFSPGAGIAPTVGAYGNANRYMFGTTAGPTMAVSGLGNGCNTLAGSFTIRELERDPTGGIDRLALDFEQFCEGSPRATRGEVRIRTTLPDSHAGADRAVTSGARVTLDGNASSATVGSLSAFSWRQVSGTPVTLSGANGAIAEFTAPQLAVGAADEVVVFELEITDSRQMRDRAYTAITVQAPVPAANPPPANPPQNSPPSGGGGGALDGFSLVALLLAAGLVRRGRILAADQSRPAW